MDQSKCINYFIVDGKKYYAGTVFIAKEMGKEVGAVFVCTYFASHVYIVYKIDGKQRMTPVQMFKDKFIRISGVVDNETKMPQTKHMRDFDINGMAIGWLWYIFLMAISFIFKDCIGLWILISVVFFSWRNNKIQKEGTYIEW